MFCRALGRELAAERNLVLVTGGFRRFRDEPGRPSADWMTVVGARDRLGSSRVVLNRRIETFLPETDARNISRFRIGRVHTLPHRNRQSRRFTLVVTSDVVAAVEGDENTREIVDLAFALDKPCLPLPFAGGVAATRWRENRLVVQERFGIDDRTARQFERMRLGKLSPRQTGELAARVRELLFAKLKRRCFIIMPFRRELNRLYELAVRPAVAEANFTAVRADELLLVGNAVGLLQRAIGACDCAIAVLTGMNTNVMYELGYAHALDKPAVLLVERRGVAAAVTALPFDIRNERVLTYGKDLDELRLALATMLKEGTLS